MLSANPKLAAIGGFLAVATAMIPTVAVNSGALADMIKSLFVLGAAKAVLIVWFVHALFPGAAQPPPAPAGGHGGGIGWALLAVAILTPLHLYFITKGEVVFVILLSLTTLLAQGGFERARRFAAAALAGNLAGALAAAAADFIVTLQPTWLVLSLTTLGVALLFAGRIVRNDPAAPIFVMGLVTFVALFGLSQTTPPLLSDVPVFSRIFDIAIGSAYALGLIAVFAPTSVAARKAA